MTNQQLAKERKILDQIDMQIVKLLKERSEHAIKIGKLKSGTVYLPEREVEVMRKVIAQNDSALSDEAMESIYRQIIGACRNLQKQLRVAYLGPEGSYSHEAAVNLFGASTQFIASTDFFEAVRKVEVNSADVAIIPLENSSEGGVNETYKLLQTTRLGIIAEYTMPILHQLLTYSKSLDDIVAVHAHSQALGQCRQWLRKHLPSASLVGETSSSEASKIATSNTKYAAIASNQASKIYSLPILIQNINDDPDNKTTFIALSKLTTMPTGNDKTSIICTAKDKPGALYELLKVFNERRISLTRLQSQPHREHMYSFYIDFEGHQNDKIVSDTLNELSKTARSLKILGSYPKERTNGKV